MNNVMAELPPPSAEQSAFLRAVAHGNNVIMDCVPGSGKTTSALYVALQFPDKQIMLVTYNRDLKQDTCRKVQALGLTNIIATNYHSLCCKYYAPNTWKEQHIIENVLEPDAALHGLLGGADILIVDEAQDMTLVLFQLVDKFCRDTERPQIIVLGDKHQNIYGFANADARFIQRAPDIYRDNNRPWMRVPLSESHRLTKPMAEFMNSCVLDAPRIVSRREGLPVQYWNVNIHKVADRLFETIKSSGWKPEDVLVLAPSLSSSEGSPIVKLVNVMAANQWPVEVQADDSKGGEACTRHKTLVTSYHRSKGLGRACVIVFSADASYYQFYDTTCDPLLCSNAQYVAYTRSYHTLILLKHFEQRPLPFLTGKHEELCKCATIIEDDDAKKFKSKGPNPEKERRATPYAMTRMLKHLPDEVLLQAVAELTLTPMPANAPHTKIHLPSESVQGPLTERVSDLTGVALPMMLAHEVGADADLETMRWKNPRLCALMKRAPNTEPGALTIREALLIALLKDASSTCMRHRLRQIRKFDWVADGVASECVQRLREMLDPLIDWSHAAFERQIEGTSASGRGLRGVIDIFNAPANVPIEVKCSSALSTEHFLQVAGYMYMLESAVGYVVNPVTYELVRVTATHQQLTAMMERLERYKLERNVAFLSDEAFLEQCWRITRN